MATGKSPLPESPARELVLTRILAAPRRSVFEAWTDPARFAQWWGPQGFTNPRCELDVRPGGKIRVDMRGPDGTVYKMGGEFRESVPPERLAFLSSALDSRGQAVLDTLNTVALAERDGRTTVTVRVRVTSIVPGAEAYLAGMDQGWNETLDRLVDFAGAGAAARTAAVPDAESNEATSDREIVLSRVYDAPRELVWDAFTRPEHVVHWWGPNGFTTTIEE